MDLSSDLHYNRCYGIHFYGLAATYVGIRGWVIHMSCCVKILWKITWIESAFPCQFQSFNFPECFGIDAIVFFITELTFTYLSWSAEEYANGHLEKSENGHAEKAAGVEGQTWCWRSELWENKKKGALMLALTMHLVS